MPGRYFMTLLNKAFELAFKEAEKAREEGEIPVGAVIFSDTEIISSAHNLREQKKSPTAHAEILAIEEASKKVSDWRLSDLNLAVTLEPCVITMNYIIIFSNCFYWSITFTWSWEVYRKTFIIIILIYFIYT